MMQTYRVKALGFMDNSLRKPGEVFTSPTLHGGDGQPPMPSWLENVDNGEVVEKNNKLPKLSELSLVGFKCFRCQDFPLGQLTLFTGYNAAGKSSAIQGLLFLAQYFRDNPKTHLASLNGSLTTLGTFSELVNEAAPESIQVGVTLNGSDDNPAAKLSFSFKRHGKLMSENEVFEYQLFSDSPNIKKRVTPDLSTGTPESIVSGVGNDNLKKTIEIIREIIYISAKREMLKSLFPAVTSSTHVHADVGTDGRFAPWWFDQYSDKGIDEERLHPQEGARTLRRQFNAWASDIFPGAQANTQQMDIPEFVKLELRISESQDWSRPSNTGYGLSYTFPILVAGLLAKPGQLLIIDSPEAHLHPAGQSILGRFLAMVAKSGVQVIVETHSDHFLNGIRVAVKNGNISNKEVQIHFFENKKEDNGYSSHVTTINVDRNGKLSDWPDGFFDQSDKDLTELTSL